MGSARLPLWVALRASSRTLVGPVDHVDLAHRLDVRNARVLGELTALCHTSEKIDSACRGPAQLGLDVHDG